MAGRSVREPVARDQQTQALRRAKRGPCWARRPENQVAWAARADTAQDQAAASAVDTHRLGRLVPIKQMEVALEEAAATPAEVRAVAALAGAAGPVPGNLPRPVATFPPAHHDCRAVTRSPRFSAIRQPAIPMRDPAEALPVLAASVPRADSPVNQAHQVSPASGVVAASLPAKDAARIGVFLAAAAVTSPP